MQGPFDALTGLPCGSLFIHRLHQSMRLAESDGYGLAVVSIGIENAPDTASAGNPLLAAAQRLLPCMGPYDTLGRLEGHDFVAVLVAMPAAADVAERCQQLIAAVGAPGIRAGIAVFPHDGAASTTLLRHADQARGYAAEQGLACQFFSAEAQRKAQDRAGMAAALRDAGANSELLLLYQPLAELRGGAIATLEALVRWQHPHRGLLAAADFIPIAEAAGLDNELADWVLQRACRDLCAWRDAGHTGVRVTLNISQLQFRDPAFPGHVAATLERHGLTPDLLALEITETALTMAGADCDATLAAFHRHGLGLTLDDFGTGNSSLANLKRFPFDALKIDIAFVRNVATSASDAAMCRTMIDMAHHLGMRAVAEGVETESQCDFLRRNMCDMIQGYFFAEPLPPEGIAGLLREQHRLPPHLLHAPQRQRRLLLVDDEPNIVASLKRLLRSDRYQIHTAHSGQEGLDVLAQHAIDVIVSDQRMPGMLGVDFLRKAKQLYPDTIRIMLSGYTELQSVTDAVNEGAIYKFLTKPWEDELLRKQIAEAFRVKEIADDNARLYLELHAANQELAAANQRMERLLRETSHGLDRAGPGIAPDVLRQLPLAVLGVDDAGVITFASQRAEMLLAHAAPLPGAMAGEVMPVLFGAPAGASGTAPLRDTVDIGNGRYAVHTCSMGGALPGRLIVLMPAETTP
jgi:EAL domain-containing protein (putative c-di-GMP-specific phosphodiesterase class I)/FixJ family two-component response regulator/GGDEF domain-containing protein